MTHILAIALMAAMGAQQTGSVPPYNPNPPQIPPAFDNSSETYAYTSDMSMSNGSTTGSLVISSFSTPTIIIKSTGDTLMVGNDEKGKIVFTLYRDGHVEYTDKRAVDETLKFFWKAMADSYSYMLKTACHVQKEQLK